MAIDFKFNSVSSHWFLIILILLILILAVFWQVQDHNFIDYDDHLYVTSNYRIQTEISL